MAGAGNRVAYRPGGSRGAAAVAALVVSVCSGIGGAAFGRRASPAPAVVQTTAASDLARLPAPEVTGRVRSVSTHFFLVQTVLGQLVDVLTPPSTSYVAHSTGKSLRRESVPVGAFAVVAGTPVGRAAFPVAPLILGYHSGWPAGVAQW